jgi:hypothetical protein
MTHVPLGWTVKLFRCSNPEIGQATSASQLNQMADNPFALIAVPGGGYSDDEDSDGPPPTPPPPIDDDDSVGDRLSVPPCLFMYSLLFSIDFILARSEEVRVKMKRRRVLVRKMAASANYPLSLGLLWRHVRGIRVQCSK